MFPSSQIVTLDLDEKDKNVTLTNEGIDSIEKLLNNIGILKNNNFYDPENLNLVHHTNQALKASLIFKKDKEKLSLVVIDEGSI